MAEPDSGTTGASEDVVYLNNSRKQSDIKDCKYHGRDHPHRKCPAYGKTCNNCCINHFSNACKASSTSTGKTKPVSAAKKKHKKECIKCGKNNRNTLYPTELILKKILSCQIKRFQLFESTVKLSKLTVTKINMLSVRLWPSLTLSLYCLVSIATAFNYQKSLFWLWCKPRSVLQCYSNTDMGKAKSASNSR